MFSLLPVSLWHPAYTSDSQARGSGFKYHFLQIFILNSVEFYRISKGKSRLVRKLPVLTVSKFCQRTFLHYYKIRVVCGGRHFDRKQTFLVARNRLHLVNPVRVDWTGGSGTHSAFFLRRGFSEWKQIWKHAQPICTFFIFLLQMSPLI